MKTFPQHTPLTAKIDFQFKPGGKGRNVIVRKGQRFWVTSSQTLQMSEAAVRVDRKGKGSISQGYPFTPEQIQTLFDL